MFSICYRVCGCDTVNYNPLEPLSARCKHIYGFNSGHRNLSLYCTTHIYCCLMRPSYDYRCQRTCCCALHRLLLGTHLSSGPSSGLWRFFPSPLLGTVPYFTHALIVWAHKCISQKINGHLLFEWAAKICQTKCVVLHIYFHISSRFPANRAQAMQCAFCVI